MELRWRRAAIAEEAFTAALATAIPAAVTSVWLTIDLQYSRWWFIATFIGFALLPMPFLAIFRWRTRLKIDSEGISTFRSGDDPSLRIGWGEVRELFRTDKTALLVRGPSGSILVTANYQDHEDALRIIRERAGAAIGERLRSEYRERGAVTFQASWSRAWAHAFYLAALLALSGYSTYLVWAMWRFHTFSMSWRGSTLAGGLIWLYFLWQARHAASWTGGRVTMKPAGLAIRRLDGEKLIGWEDVVGVEWNKYGGLDVRLCTGKRVALPYSLGNLPVLKRFIEERLGSADGPQGPLSSIA